MKKKLTFLALLCIAATFSAGLAACGNNQSSTPHQHTLVYNEAVPPKCTEQGYVEYWFCTGCKKIFTDSEALNEITVSEVAMPPLNHDYGDWVEINPANCTEPGEEKRVCKNDSDHFETREIPANGHTFVNGVCEVCNAPQPETEGLAYTAVKEGEEIRYYIVSGIGDAKDEKSILIPATYNSKPVLSIAEYAFADCINLETVIIQDNISVIGNSAFLGCINLTSILLPDGLVSISASAFEHTGYYDDEDNWTDGALYIGDYLIKVNVRAAGAFTIKEDTALVAAEAFKDCSYITSVTIPSSVKTIGVNTFSGCSSLEEYLVDGGNENYKSISGILYNGDATEILWIPACVEGKVEISPSVTSIGNSLFSGCTKITEIVIHEGVKTVGTRAFASCTSLSYVSLPSSLETLGEYAFYGCTALKSVEFAESNGTVIGPRVFYGCTKLTSVTLAEGLEEIGDYAFTSCSIISITLPVTLLTLGDRVFNGCYKLVEIQNLSLVDLDDGSVNLGYNCNVLNIYNENGSSKLVTEGDYIFYRDGNVCYLMGYTGNDTDIVLPSYNGGAYEIYKYAFYQNTALNSVTVASGVTVIGEYAFASCQLLTSVTLPASIERVEKAAFNLCFPLKDVYYGGSEEMWNNIVISSLNTYLENANKNFAQ